MPGFKDRRICPLRNPAAVCLTYLRPVFGEQGRELTPFLQMGIGGKLFFLQMGLDYKIIV